MAERYSRTRRRVVLRPLVMESPSGEVEITFSRMPGPRGTWPWVLKVRDLYASGRGRGSLIAAMTDFARELRVAGVGEPAGELARLAEAWED